MPTLPNGQLPPLDEEEATDYREDLDIEDDVLPPEPERTETEIERQARQMGWHPREEYLGPPHRWKSAEEFMRQGQDVLPILRDNNKRLLDKADRQDREIQALRQSMADQTQALQELREMARTARQSGYDKAVNDLKAQQREAAATGDVETYDRVSEQIEETIRARAEAVPKPQAPPPSQPQVDPAVISWVQRNPLYTSDIVLNHAMQAEHQRLKEDEPELTLADNLEKAWNTVKQRYPRKFGLTQQAPPPNGQQPRRPSGAAPVSQPTGGPRSPSPRRGSPIDQIEDPGDRAEARASFNRLKNQISGYTEEEYMQVYNNPRADIIEVRRTLRENRENRK